jgi:chorismate mutase
MAQEQDLQLLRAQIDKLDRQILGLIGRRMQIVTDIKQVKEHHGLEVYQPDREQELVERLVREKSGPLDPEAVRAIWTAIMQQSKALQARGAKCADRSATAGIVRAPSEL